MELLADVQRMELPADVQRYIYKLMWAAEAADVTREVHPHVGSVYSNPFLMVGPLAGRLKARRAVGKRVPPLLAPLYAQYAATTDFSNGHGLVLLAEESMETHAGDVVDFAMQYCGMGHALVHSYRACSDTVMTFLDGGANGYDCAANRRDRLAAVARFAHSGVCYGQWGPPVPFVPWWHACASHNWA